MLIICDVENFSSLDASAAKSYIRRAFGRPFWRVDIRRFL